jgi:hypothetical protein
LRYGGEIAPLALVKNASTSVQMLERFYRCKLGRRSSPLIRMHKRPAREQACGRSAGAAG